MDSIWPVGTGDLVYNLLVSIAGANENERADFVYHFASTAEHRFRGKLGFGGKFWDKGWTVTCYPEDMSDERKAVIDLTNAALAMLRKTQERRKLLDKMTAEAQSYPGGYK